MNLSRPFILRPVATTLLMAAIILAGLAAYQMLPVAALPEVDYPTIQVRTFYPGGSPDVMASSVTAPLERQFGQMPGLTLMTSTSSSGSSIITLQFTLELGLDVAEQQVQAAINAAFTYLPADLPTPPVYSKVNPADAPILTLALTSKTMSLPQVEDLADTRFAQKISQLPGVGLVSISGGQRPAVRIQVNPEALAAYGLTLEDVRAALAAANVNQAKGSFDGPRQSYIIDANDQLFTASKYRPIVIAFRNGAPVRLSDVAEAVDDAENVLQAAWMNNTPAVIVNIQRQPGANVIQVVDHIKALLPQLRGSLPSSVQVSILTDRTTTIRASVRDVEFELMLAVALVVMVIFLFLRNLSATLIPSVAVPLSLIGTFGAMYLLGFSLNNLSLMALTISTGFVVDDAIVMIENIARYIEEGESPLEAALKGAKQIGFTILSLTISLIAVLIPLLFMSDVVGRLFREFAITLGITILFSAVVSLTLTPMMCARLLKHTPKEQQGRFYRVSQEMFDRTIAFYGRTLRWVLGRRGATLVVAAGTLALTIFLYVIVPKGFFPVEDTGVIQGISEAAQSVSFPAMVGRQQQLSATILRDPAVESLSSFIGIDGTNSTLNSGRILINLKPLKERKINATEVIRRLQSELSKVEGIMLYMQPVQDLTVDARVSRTQFQYTIEDPDAKELYAWAPKLVEALRKRPELRDVSSDQQDKGLRLAVTIDRPTASRLGIQPQDVDNALYDAYGQRMVSIIFTQLNQYRVILAVKPQYQQDPWKLGGMYLRGAAGGQVPLSAITQASETTGPLLISRQGQFPSVTVSFDLQRAPPLKTACRRSWARPGTCSFPRVLGQLPGHRPCLQGLPGQRAPPDTRGARDRLHRARHPVRELHPPHHHPVDPAVGRRGRPFCPPGVRDRVQRHCPHRHHPAHRHREEERDHDSRLRAGSGAKRGEEPGGGDLSGVPAQVPADHDDHHGRPPRGTSPCPGHGCGLGAAPPPGHFHCGGPHHQPDTDPLHDAGDLPRLRPTGETPEGPSSEGTGERRSPQ